MLPSDKPKPRRTRKANKDEDADPFAAHSGFSSAKSVYKEGKEAALKPKKGQGTSKGGERKRKEKESDKDDFKPEGPDSDEKSTVAKKSSRATRSKVKAAEKDEDSEKKDREGSKPGVNEKYVRRFLSSCAFNR